MRVVLFVPALDPHRVAKALGLPVDAVIIDLEDAVPADRKKEARTVLASLAETVARAVPGVWVRINGLNTPHWKDDLACAAAVRALGIMVPKAELPTEIASVADFLSDLEAAAGWAGSPAYIVPLVESARGVLNAVGLAHAPRVARMGIGPLDLAADLRLPYAAAGPQPVDHARLQLVYASAAAGIKPPIDGVFPNFSDPAALEADTRAAFGMGMAGKMIIHPGQIQPVREAFRPSPEAVTWARQALAAASEGSGAVRLGAQMIDRPLILAARQVLRDLEPQGGGDSQ